jgi:hypothetical protein
VNRTLKRRIAPLVVTMAAGTATPAWAQCQPEWLAAPMGNLNAPNTDMPVDCSTTWTAPGETVPRLVLAGRFNSVAGGTFSHIVSWDGTRWLALGTGMNGNIQSVFDFNGTLVATGLFTSAGGVAVQNIARWNGSSWSAMGTLDNYGSALQMHSGFLFVGGAFTHASGVVANHLARWNTGTGAWEAVNSGLNGNVLALGLNSVSGSPVPSLIIGGDFTTANGTSASHIVGYNLDLGGPWYTLGTGVNGSVKAILGGYVGGSFTSAGGVSTGGFALWNGFNWQANGGFFNGQVYALANYFDQVTGTNQVVIGGNYPGINNSPSIAYYNGTSYSTPGTGGIGGNGSVFTLTPYNSSLIVGGAFTSAGGVFTQNLARWSGSPSTTTSAQRGWSPLFPSPSAPVRALLPAGGNFFYVGGDFLFQIDSGDLGPHLFETDGTTSEVVTDCLGCGHVTGTSGSVSALGNLIVGSSPFITTNYLIMGGLFTQAGGVPASNIARFSGTGGYAAMGTGTDGRVNAVVQLGPVTNAHLIVAGEFNTAGGISTRGVAQWSGSSWSLTGTSGLAGGTATGYALAIYNGEVVLGGNFGSVSGVGTGSIARWTGTGWATVSGQTLSGSVRALKVFNGSLVAAGDFTSSAPALDRVASWNGATWTPMSAGLPSASVFTGTSLAVHKGELYLGGTTPFSEGPGSPKMIYKWNGAAWSAVAGSPLRSVYALASAGDTLWAGGDFGVAAGHATPYITKMQCACYANCDNSSTSPVLNVADFNCFLTAYAAGDPYANCDGSTQAPVLNVGDFSCFLTAYAAGCP